MAAVENKELKALSEEIAKEQDELKMLTVVLDPLLIRVSELKRQVDVQKSKVQSLKTREALIMKKMEVEKNIADGYVYSVTLNVSSCQYVKNRQLEEYFGLVNITNKKFNMTRDALLKCRVTMSSPWKLPEDKYMELTSDDDELLIEVVVEDEKTYDEDAGPIDVKEYLEWRYPEIELEEDLKEILWFSKKRKSRGGPYGYVSEEESEHDDEWCIGCGNSLPTYKGEEDLFITFENSNWSFCFHNGRFNPERDCAHNISAKFKKIGYDVPQVLFDLLLFDIE
ncbi:MAG: hypothetical protein Harvfovirus55_8 [Harvfovirus sp.]|uniref:Uncharacterized protein n=1 Tax=Harvfovirus sp. TaxID=2487768 RepID=A0A3G5A8M6_9VIRU|nr:MAG: hypothetical protein Harvfovirus55_8 [Harvfovirus sp.]